MLGKLSFRVLGIYVWDLVKLDYGAVLVVVFSRMVNQFYLGMSPFSRGQLKIRMILFCPKRSLVFWMTHIL